MMATLAQPITAALVPERSDRSCQLAFDDSRSLVPRCSPDSTIQPFNGLTAALASTINARPSTVRSASEISNSKFEITASRSLTSDLHHPAVLTSHLSPLTSEILDPTTDASWNQRLSAFPSATAFHTANWARVLAEAYGFAPCYIVAQASEPAEQQVSQPAPQTHATIERLNDSTAAAILPLFSISSRLTGRRGISLPFTDFCEPLVAQPDFTPGQPRPCSSVPDSSASVLSVSSVVENLLSAAVSLGRERNWKYLELRSTERAFSSVKTPTSPTTPTEPRFVQHDLDLTVGEEHLWRGLSPSCQRAIRKARAADATVRKADFTSPRSSRDLRAFYDLQCRTRRKHGLPPQPFRFFELIQRHMLEAGLGSLYLAEIAGPVANRKVLAGAIYLHFGKSVTFKYGASDERHLDLRANNLVMWQAISDYAAAGFATLNFGRTELDNSGLKRYKMGFGPLEKPLNYARFNYATNTFVPPTGDGTLTRLAQPFFRCMPISVGRAVGSLLYSHVA